MGYVRDKQGGEGAVSQRGLRELRTSRQLQSNWAGSFSRSQNTEKSVKSHTGDLRGTTAFLWSRNQLFTVTVLTMRSVCVCFCLALLLPWRVQSQRSRPALTRLDEDTQRDVLAFDMLNRSGVLNSLLRSEHHLVLRRARPPRPASQVPKRAQQGSRFALSLDVPTSILSVLIDLAKNQDMRTKAAANAELMARIGKRK